VGPAETVLASAANRLPKRLQEHLYVWGGSREGISPRALPAVNGDDVATWIPGLYPRRRYPAVAIGSANGAAVHLWAGLGIPWLPQTFLVLVVRRGVHVDEPWEQVRWAASHAETALRMNPDLVLRYFRFKRQTLGAVYEHFLRECLVPDGTIVLIECGIRWPTTTQGERHVFQFGAVGGATGAEYLNGGPRVADYLRRYRSHRIRWEAPIPDGTNPEAEWGFAPALRADVESFARRHGYRVRRLLLDEPEDLSPLVADLYRWWYDRLGVGRRRLVVDSFILMDPYWTIRTRSVPFWMVFNKEPSFRALEGYLGATADWNELFITLFSHGVESIGLVPIDWWRSLFPRAARAGDFIGVDPRAFPRDFAVFARYHFDFLRKVAGREPLPPALSLNELGEFLGESRTRYRVQWLG
jgi:hypothetical protein